MSLQSGDPRARVAEGAETNGDRGGGDARGGGKQHDGSAALHPALRAAMRDPSLRTKGQNLTAAIAQPLDEELGWDTIQAKFQGLLKVGRLAVSDADAVPAPAPSTLPTVDPNSFAPYLSLMRDLFPSYEKARVAFQRPSELLLAMAKEAGAVPQGLSAFARTHPGLDALPPVLFEETFDLSDPGVFYALSSLANDVTWDLDRIEARVSDMELKAVTVQEALLSEIGLRMDSLFGMIAGIQELEGMVAKALVKATTAREGLTHFDGRMAATARQVTTLDEDRDNLQSTMALLADVQHVQKCREALWEMLQAQDVPGSLDALRSLTQALSDKNIGRLRCFTHAGDILAGSREAVGNLILQEFLKATANAWTQALAERAARVASAQGAGRKAPEEGADAEDPWVTDRGWKDWLVPLVGGLSRVGAVSTAVSCWEEQTTAEIKQTIWVVVESTLKDFTGSGGSDNLGRKLASLQHQQFLAMLAGVLIVAESSVRFARAVADALEGALRATRIPIKELRPIVARCQGAIRGLCEATCGRCAKLMSTRDAAHAKLRLPELAQLLSAVGNLDRFSEDFGAKPYAPLRSVVQAQCKAWVDGMHQRHVELLDQVLQTERWAPAKVARHFQAVVDAVESHHAAGASNGDGDDGQRALSVAWRDGAGGRGRAGAKKGAGGAVGAHGSEDGDAAERLVVQGHAYSAVNSLLMLLQSLQEYMGAAEELEWLQWEVSHRAVELLRVFNSRTSQLVAGQGAKLTAGLPDITAEHLASACQALDILEALLPSLAAALTWELQPPRYEMAADEWQKLQRDIQVHRQEMLVPAIGRLLGDELEAMHRDELAAVAARWASASDASGPGPYAQYVLEQTRSVVETMVRIMGQEPSRPVVSHVVHRVSEAVAAALSKLTPPASARNPAAWHAQRAREVSHIASGLQGMPMDPISAGASMQAIRLLQRRLGTAAGPLQR